MDRETLKMVQEAQKVTKELMRIIEPIGKWQNNLHPEKTFDDWGKEYNYFFCEHENDVKENGSISKNRLVDLMSSAFIAFCAMADKDNDEAMQLFNYMFSGAPIELVADVLKEVKQKTAILWVETNGQVH